MVYCSRVLFFQSGSGGSSLRGAPPEPYKEGNLNVLLNEEFAQTMKAGDLLPFPHYIGHRGLCKLLRKEKESKSPPDAAL